ncbi:hypothetical protein FLX08_16910 [Microbispora hainanensis]|uniref:Uncharacterized protein n=1 Tax=Microbispora hainanensis TaxID=568844 RepID=A0A544YU23_9ACTN|nr:hypothetical protein FLX08_16910 [Microbispora hainanensis]
MTTTVRHRAPASPGGRSPGVGSSATNRVSPDVRLDHSPAGSPHSVWYSSSGVSWVTWTTTSAPSSGIVTLGVPPSAPFAPDGSRQPTARPSPSRAAAPGQSRGTPTRVVLVITGVSWPRSATATDVSTHDERGGPNPQDVSSASAGRGLSAHRPSTTRMSSATAMGLVPAFVVRRRTTDLPYAIAPEG